MSTETSLVVNGRDVVLAVDPTTPLVLALRNDLGLRGVRPGCGVGECGSCVVLVDGRATRSCQTPLSTVAGADVVTPEGLATPDAQHPVQQAFLEEQAAQCGYCINGMVMSVVGLLEKEPAPDEERIQDTLAEHLCRCGTHHRVLRAVRRLAGQDVPPMPHVVSPPDLTQAEVDSEPPGALRKAPDVEDWLRHLPDGRIEVLSGRVELGQGVRTALAQIVAAELEEPVERIVVRSAATDASPDEGYTAGSASMEQGGAALARAAAAFRRLRAEGREPVGPIEATDVPRWTGAPLGEPIPRSDLVEKLTGGASYVHDLALPGMLHARVLLPPTYDARPRPLDLAEARRQPGVEAVVPDGGFVLVVAEREEQAVRAVERLARSARWDDPGLDLGELRALPATRFPVVEDAGVMPALDAGRRMRATYAKPYEAHGAIAPSGAVAQAYDDGMAVWTHGQGVYPLRRELAALLDVAEDTLTVRHVDGPGCYGHNGADDAAGFAVLSARAVPGRPVRFQFSVADELGWEPYGSAMLVDLDASLDETGRIAAWRHVVRTDAHTSRPRGSGGHVAAAWLRTSGAARPWDGTGEGGVRNAVPMYDIPFREVVADYVRGPVRTSALRTLGAYANVFAIESFMDELAEAAGQDPVAFRLAHMRDERARAVLETAVESAGWRSRVGPSGGGQGVAVARYKNAKAYVAVVADAEVDTTTGTVRVRRVVASCDAGVVINPDGLRNQLEGGILQGLSRALHEEVRIGGEGIESRDWTSYPVLRFAEVPRLDVVLLDRPGHPPLGAGEASTPPTPAALANAVDDAVGIRVRTLPLTPDRLRNRLESMSDEELERVRV